MTISSNGKASSNPDLLPTGQSRRTSTAWDIASLWIGLVVGIPSYYVAGTLVEKGMTWWQGILVVIGANCVLLLPLLLHGEPGTRYGIPFPVLARSAFGVHGACVPALLRALVACGWFGIETWFGGQVIFILLPSYLTRSCFANRITWLATSPLELSCFVVFWSVQLAALWNGMQGIRRLGNFSAPILVALSALLLGWASVEAGGFGPLIYQPSRLTTSEFWSLFFPSLTANVGSWAAMALSIPDFTRYARSQADQVLGQLGLPLFMGGFAFVGLVVTSSTEIIFGQTISNPIKLLAAMKGVLTLLLGVPGITLAILTTNIPANIVAPANALVSLCPSIFSFKRGALLTALIGAIIFQPWRIVNSPESFLYTWLVGYSAVMGPLEGIMIVDYYVIRRRILVVDDLYTDSPAGSYYYYKGINLMAMLTLVVSFAPIVPGFLHKLGLVQSLSPVFVFIYNVGWFFGFFSSGLLYFALFQFAGRFAGRRLKVYEVTNGRNFLKDLLLPTAIESCIQQYLYSFEANVLFYPPTSRIAVVSQGSKRRYQCCDILCLPMTKPYTSKI